MALTKKVVSVAAKNVNLGDSLVIRDNTGTKVEPIFHIDNYSIIGTIKFTTHAGSVIEYKVIDRVSIINRKFKE